ncbi:hypothetical protein PV04_04296 [Phialophora macrospora]|uniref:Uncharacterized protein n=1 Tax=Phialophora macrospora TaxID=1851006 RepID=A0A0D2FJQ0_9EURO|nr:hypothetical protein PV04_04296 [Phialophora macrospora]
MSKRIVRQVFLKELPPVDKPLAITLEDIAATLEQLLRERSSKEDRGLNGQKDTTSDSEG